MTNDYIHRQTVLRCIKESRDGIDWGQSEDGDAFLHYSAALYRTVASKEYVPAADVVEVVRCKDCENWQTDWNPSIPDRHYCAVIDSMMKANDFCSYGERREENKNDI